MKDINEYIAENTPFIREIHDHYKRVGIYIDTMDQKIKSNCALAYKLKQDGLTKEEILTKLHKLHLEVGSWVYCDDKDFGTGRVKEFFTSGMFVKFNKRPLATMCDKEKLVTIHDDKKRKIKHIA